MFYRVLIISLVFISVPSYSAGLAGLWPPKPVSTPAPKPEAPKPPPVQPTPPKK